MRHEPEIKTEIKTLRKMQPNVRKTSIFGDNHHDAIEKQIEVLLDDSIGPDEIYDEHDTGDITENVKSAAIEAIDWREGDSDDAPSEDWKSLLVN